MILKVMKKRKVKCQVYRNGGKEQSKIRAINKKKWQMKGTMDENLVILFHVQIQETVLMEHTNYTTFLTYR